MIFILERKNLKMKNNNGWIVSTFFLLGIMGFIGGFSGAIKVLSFDPLRACVITLILALTVFLIQIPVLINKYIEKRGI